MKKMDKTIHFKHNFLTQLLNKHYGSSSNIFNIKINNLSHYILNDTEEFVLKHGLEFYVSSSKINKERTLSVFQLSYMQLLKHKPTSTDALMAFKARLVDLAHMGSRSTLDKSDFYLHHKRLNAVKPLCNNNIISKPDKRAGFVILVKEDYNNKMADILKNTLDTYLIRLSVTQEGIKCHFLSLWYDSA